MTEIHEATSETACDMSAWKFNLDLTLVWLCLRNLLFSPRNSGFTLKRVSMLISLEFWVYIIETENLYK